MAPGGYRGAWISGLMQPDKPAFFHCNFSYLNVGDYLVV